VLNCPGLHFTGPVGCGPGQDLYVWVLVGVRSECLLAGVDMTERVAGTWMQEKMD
jgi:hypothetical protein